MVQRKRNTASKTPDHKAAKLNAEEEVTQEQNVMRLSQEEDLKGTDDRNAAEEEVTQEQDVMRLSQDEDLKESADRNDANKAEADRKNAEIAEANVVYTVEVDIEEKKSEKSVKRENRWIKSDKVAADTTNGNNLEAEPIIVDIVAAQPKHDEIVASELKNEGSGEAQQKTEEIKKAEQNNSQNVMAEQKSVQKAMFENAESEQKNDLKTSGGAEGEVEKINIEKLEVGQINTENVDAEQKIGMSKTQMRKLLSRQGVKFWEKKKKKNTETLMAEESHSLKVEEENKLEKVEAELKNAGKARPEKKIVAVVEREVDKKVGKVGSEKKIVEVDKKVVKAGTEKKIVVVVEGEVYKKVGKAVLEEKNVEVVEGEVHKKVGKAGPEKKNVEVVEGEVDKKGESGQKNIANNGLSKTQRKKLKKLEQFNVLEKAGTEQKNSVKLDAQQSNGMSKRQKRKMKKLENLINKKAKEERESTEKLVASVQKKPEGTVQEKPEGTVQEKSEGTVQEKPEKMDTDEVSKGHKRKQRSKKRKHDNKEIEGHVKKISDEEHKKVRNKKQKTNDATITIEMLVDSLSKDELSETLKMAVQKHSDLSSHIEGVADRDPSRRKVFVGNLSSNTKSGMLRKVFSQYGEIDEAEVIKDRSTGKCKGFGFVTFKSLSSALIALRDPKKEINGQIAGCTIARPQRSTDLYSTMLGPGGFVSSAMLGPGGVVSPAMLGSGGFVWPAIHGPRVRPPMFGNHDPQVAMGNLGSSNHLNSYPNYGLLQHGYVRT